MPEPSAEDLYAHAVHASQVGQIPQALALLRQLVDRYPAHADGWRFLGILAADAGDMGQAADCFRRAVAAAPGRAIYLTALATAVANLKRYDEALAVFRQALPLDPADPFVHNGLGCVSRELGRWDDAERHFREAVRLDPRFAEARTALGAVLIRRGLFAEALGHIQAMLAAQPNQLEALNNAGLCHRALGDAAAAEAVYRRALAIKPGFVEAHSNLGLVLQSTGRAPEAMEHFRAAIRLQPAFVEGHRVYGGALLAQHQSEAALAEFDEALRLDPNQPQLWNDRGIALRDVARIEEAVASHRRALALKPDFSLAHSNLVLALHYDQAAGPREILAEARAFARQFEEPVRHAVLPHQNDRTLERPLRIGYVSPDFSGHVVGRVILPVLARHDRAAFSVYCYSDVAVPDQVTRDLQRSVRTWRNICGMPDESVAQIIRQDAIDILVDLSQHTAGNRLTLFARRPAPVQVSWLGCPSTTGISSIDYRISDPHLDPPASEWGRDTTDDYSEATWRLPATSLCYDAIYETADAPDVRPRKAGPVVFGSLNKFFKMNGRTLQLWARVLAGVADSRLILRAQEGRHRESVRRVLVEGGIAPERVDMLPPCASRAEYLQTYGRIDIALDPFPYNGFTTSFDAFYMGVPLVSLAGETVVSRAGRSQLINLGLGDLSTRSDDEFVRAVVGLTQDMPRLAELRGTLRQRMRTSPLMDTARFTQNLEEAYRGMWRRWCGA